MVSVTPPGSTEALTRERITAKPPLASRKTPTKPQRPVEPSELDCEEDSELSEGVSESEPESVPQPEQVSIRNEVSRKKKNLMQKHKNAARYKPQPVYLAFCRLSGLAYRQKN